MSGYTTPALLPSTSMTTEVTAPIEGNFTHTLGTTQNSKTEEMLQSKIQAAAESECIEKPNDMAGEYSNEEEEDTSSSDLRWDLMSITSAQSGTALARFDTIEDVSHAIGKTFIHNQVGSAEVWGGGDNYIRRDHPSKQVPCVIAFVYYIIF